jgi:hypothetical protein
MGDGDSGQTPERIAMLTAMEQKGKSGSYADALQHLVC